MSTTTGRKAESIVAEYLIANGYRILDVNWRTRRSEIDIVALKKVGFLRSAQVAICVEVKYRSTDRQGSGLAYITPKKLQQMQFAAKEWIHESGWNGDVRLLAVAVTGLDFRITETVWLD